MVTRFSNTQEFLTEFIEIYKRNKCLWNSKSKEYTDKPLRDAAYEKLIRYCKKFNPEADSHFVKDKIKGIRNCFRREQRKVQKMQELGQTYTPWLWYFDSLLFLEDQYQYAPSKETDNDSDEYEEQESYLTPEAPPPVETKPSKRIHHQIEDPLETVPAPKRQKRVDADAVYSAPTTGAIDEFSALGIYIAAKLRKLDERQRLFAEHLIHEALFKAALAQLSPFSEIDIRPQSNTIKLENCDFDTEDNKINY